LAPLKKVEVHEDAIQLNMHLPIVLTAIQPDDRSELPPTFAERMDAIRLKREYDVVRPFVRGCAFDSRGRGGYP
jgi:hypothetical protein